MMLLASAHASPSSRPNFIAGSHTVAWATYFVQIFQPVSHSHYALRRLISTTPLKTSMPYAALDASDSAIILPTIRDVNFHQEGYATLKGEGAPGVRIAIQSDAQVLGYTRVSNTGDWQIKIDQHLTHGVHRVRSVALLPNEDRRILGEEIRFALPQSLSQAAPGPSPRRDPKANQQTSKTQPALKDGDFGLRIAQVNQNYSDDGTRDDEKREWDASSPQFSTPIYEWLRRSSEIYDDVIVQDLSGGDNGLSFVAGRRDDPALDRAQDNNQAAARRQQQPWQQDGILNALRWRWQNFSVGVTEWLRQAQEVYRAQIADELSTGTRQTRDRFARNEPETRTPQEETPRDFSRETWRQPAKPGTDQRPEDPKIEERAELDNWPVVEGVPRQLPDALEPSVDWPVVGDDELATPEPPPEVKPDPVNQALIRQAEKEAERARELARQAAERAEQTRKETEALLAEERRLEQEIARRAAEEKAERDKVLEKRLSEADQRAADARRQAEDMARASREREQALAEAKAEAEKAREQAQRIAAEELAAAATSEADEKFQSGQVPEPGSVAQKKSEQPEFTVADSASPQRGSLKDSAQDAIIEEGSAFGDVDDFDPSVRYIYDMGPAKSGKIKRRALKKRSSYTKRKAKRKVYKKRRAKRRTYRARKYKARRAHVRRAYKSSRRYRKRRARYRSRIARYRMSLGMRRAVRPFGRLYKFKARRRCAHRRVSRRKIYIPRIRWRRR